MSELKIPLTLAVTAVLSACTASTSFESAQNNVSLTINDKPSIALSKPNTNTYNATSFGQYVFKAEAENSEPMYGVIPLKFNGGYLAADILFFAPALFYNLREVYPFYKLDLQTKEILYRKKETDPWTFYKPLPDEVERAKLYFAR